MLTQAFCANLHQDVWQGESIAMRKLDLDDFGERSIAEMYAIAFSRALL
jgi:hypothetical protein